jgi:hypothetical protein
MEYEISPTQTTGPHASTFSSGPRAVAAASTSRARPTRIPSGASAQAAKAIAAQRHQPHEIAGTRHGAQHDGAAHRGSREEFSRHPDQRRRAQPAVERPAADCQRGHGGDERHRRNEERGHTAAQARQRQREQREQQVGEPLRADRPGGRIPSRGVERPPRVQQQVPHEVLSAPTFRLMELDPGGARAVDHGYEPQHHGEMDGVEPHESMPKKDRKRFAPRTSEARQVDMGDDEAGQDEEQIDAEIAGLEAPPRAVRDVLARMEQQHHRCRHRTNPRQRRNVLGARHDPNHSIAVTRSHGIAHSQHPREIACRHAQHLEHRNHGQNKKTAGSFDLIDQAKGLSSCCAAERKDGRDTSSWPVCLRRELAIVRKHG